MIFKYNFKFKTNPLDEFEDIYYVINIFNKIILNTIK